MHIEIHVNIITPDYVLADTLWQPAIYKNGKVPEIGLFSDLPGLFGFIYVLFHLSCDIKANTLCITVVLHNATQGEIPVTASSGLVLLQNREALVR